MVRLVTVLVIVVGCCSVWAEDADSLRTTSQDAPVLKYRGKNRLLTGVLAWAVPSAGHAYAGDWGASKFFVAAQAAGLGVAYWGSTMEKRPCSRCEPKRTGLGEGMVTMGMTYFFLGRVTEILDAALVEAGDHRATVSLMGSTRPTVTLAVHF